ncbi:hypothetical protein Gocc_0508 [Gaiella occulta]|uniref:Uncharacterized protein n=1 Tax=Gaiella occulta TaxID=1002870 RepID=A0A7M2Z1T5_9ACTN|nr:hypothetical protein [Gaiella occulta]RDI76089.1 hypothetical protein Gocc_0508 [Gaiella occulta]
MSEHGAGEGIRLSEAEREVALAETRAVLDAAARPQTRSELSSLELALEQGVLDESHATSLERIVELGLQAGRIRAVYGPPGEQAALRLYRKLPRGAALAESAREVTDALASLRGRALESATLTAIGPGSFTLSLTTDEASLSVRLDRQGARLASVEV